MIITKYEKLFQLKGARYDGRRRGGAAAIGLAMYLLGLGFAWRRFFFKRGGAVKLTLLALAEMESIGSQRRYGADVVAGTVRSRLALALVAGIEVAALLPALRRREIRVSPADGYLSGAGGAGRY
ncbi:MAG: hypothetical protein LBD58_04750 [Treponema sp.]|jgi:hypothetical protein|nr:hypothetical protein [Treponema sp.]